MTESQPHPDPIAELRRRAEEQMKDSASRNAYERELERLNRLYAALSELNHIIVRVASREELFREVCRITTEKAGFKVAWIGWPDPQTQRVMPIAQNGEEQGYLNKIRIYADNRPEGRGPAGTCVREGQMCVINDVTGDPRMAPWRAAAAARGLRAVAALPIRFQGAVWGALLVYDSEPDVFQDKELALLKEAAEAISFAMESLERQAQRRQTEEEMRTSRANLLEAQEVACLGFYVLDIPQGRWTSSEVLDRIFDIPADYVRTVKGWGDLVHPDERQAMLDYFRVEVFGKGRPFNREYRIVRRGDGQVRWLHGLGRLEFDAAGRPIAMLGTIQDITERKRAEREKLELERRLLHAQKLESLGVLAGGVAHDFNNILAGIVGYADLAKAHLPSLELVRADLEVITQAAKRAADLTRQMLAYSGKGRFVVEPVNLSQIVEDSKQMLAMSAAKKAVITYDLAADLPPVQADAAQLCQVLMNLVINASEALGEQGGVIAVSTNALRCEAQDLTGLGLGQDLPEGPYVCLEVADSGCGMDEQTRAKIFDPFFTTKFTGRGLGLAGVQGIVRGHKGAIQVSSAPGKGTTFRVLFPASGTTPAAVQSAPTTAPTPSRGTVLVVDDEEMVRRLAQHMIEHAGFSVLTASGGHDAIRLFRERQGEVRCVLLDLTMPDLDGVEAFRELRRIRPDVRVILSSGYSEETVIERFAGEGPAGFIQKPYQLSELIARLRAVLEDGATSVGKEH